MLLAAAVDHRIVEPAAVLGALVGVEELREVEQRGSALAAAIAARRPRSESGPMNAIGLASTLTLPVRT